MQNVYLFTQEYAVFPRVALPAHGSTRNEVQKNTFRARVVLRVVNPIAAESTRGVSLVYRRTSAAAPGASSLSEKNLRRYVTPHVTSATFSVSPLVHIKRMWLRLATVKAGGIVNYPVPSIASENGQRLDLSRRTASRTPDRTSRGAG